MSLSPVPPILSLISRAKYSLHPAQQKPQGVKKVVEIVVRGVYVLHILLDVVKIRAASYYARCPD